MQVSWNLYILLKHRRVCVVTEEWAVAKTKRGGRQRSLETWISNAYFQFAMWAQPHIQIATWTQSHVQNAMWSQSHIQPQTLQVDNGHGNGEGCQV